MKNKKVITYGTFDTFHFGYWLLLKRASELGDNLTVAISSDEFNAIKNKQSFHSFEKRKDIIESLCFVNKVIKEDNWQQKRDDIINNNIDILVMGDDWTGKFDNLKDICSVVYLERTPSVCSTELKKILKK